MLIINADDYGRSKAETEAALACFLAGGITSASAMVFMEDSQRAAGLAREYNLPVGLHLNLSQSYETPVPAETAAAHERVISFLAGGKYAGLVYHPGLRRDFKVVYKTQNDEFVRLYGRQPAHVDGHHHRHLCANMLIDYVIPRGQRVRRNFTFGPGEKGWANRTYRRLSDRWLARRYQLTDYLFNLSECLGEGALTRALGLAGKATVELETHPSREAERNLLISEDFRRMRGAGL
jgi:predicted glycoside hydrolase/deacetylase ChbG (UPF0249 family)